MAKRPGVVRPSWAWFALLDGGLVVLAFLASIEGARGRAAAASPAPLPSHRSCQRMLAGAAAIHLAESFIAGRMARRRGMSPRGWRGQTLVVGFPSLLTLRRIPRTAGTEM